MLAKLRVMAFTPVEGKHGKFGLLFFNCKTESGLSVAILAILSKKAKNNRGMQLTS